MSFAEDYTVCVVPGIANNSEKAYIRTFVDYAQSNGFRLAVLNHLGSLPNVPLTSPRIFTYGKHTGLGNLSFKTDLLFYSSGWFFSPFFFSFSIFFSFHNFFPTFFLSVSLYQLDMPYLSLATIILWTIIQDNVR